MRPVRDALSRCASSGSDVGWREKPGAPKGRAGGAHEGSGPTVKRGVLYGILVLGVLCVGAALWLLRDHEDAAPQPAAEAPAAQPAPAVTPSFDIVRISPEGDTVIAGRAAPGATVVIYDGETELGRAKADERGEWVFLPEKPLPPGTRKLNLAVFPPEANAAPLRSEGDVVLVVPEGGKGPVVAVQMPKSGGVSRVLQRPGEASVGLSIAAIDYDEQGRVGISGNAQAGAPVIVYLDDAEMGRAQAGAGGEWRVLGTRKLGEGTHTARVDQLDDARQVVRRAEVEFRVDGALMAGAGEIVVVVQPGNSLWRIARRIYGEGMAYTQIFEANRVQIRDPDRIYPGQSIVVPKGKGKP